MAAKRRPCTADDEPFAPEGPGDELSDAERAYYQAACEAALYKTPEDRAWWDDWRATRFCGRATTTTRRSSDEKKSRP
jgi:hypothetical protein